MVSIDIERYKRDENELKELAKQLLNNTEDDEVRHKLEHRLAQQRHLVDFAMVPRRSTLVLHLREAEDVVYRPAFDDRWDLTQEETEALERAQHAISEAIDVINTKAR